MVFNKFMGLMLIFVACTGFGYTKYLELKKHLEALNDLKQVFFMMRSELHYTRATFEEVFEKIGGKIEGPFGTWLISLQKRLKVKDGITFSEIWERSIEQQLKESPLKKEDLDELKRVGKSLDQFENIDLFINELEYKIQRTRENYETKGKLYRSFGIMGGVFLVILLL